MVDRTDVEQGLRRSLSDGTIRPMFGFDDVEPLNRDLRRFLATEKAITSGTYGYSRYPTPLWPAVTALRLAFDGEVRTTRPFVPNADEVRLVPIDPGIDAEDGPAGYILDSLEKNAHILRESGLPVVYASLPDVRRGFLGGLGDIIFNNIRWFDHKRQTGNAAVQPTVTATSFPANRQVQWAPGHFFSTGTVFGNTKHSKLVKPSIYSFWLYGQQPTLASPLYDIQSDTMVYL